MVLLDRFLTFVVSHQALMIEGVFALSLGTVVLWLFTNLEEENKITSLADSKEIKKMLKTVLTTGPAQVGEAAASITPPKKNLQADIYAAPAASPIVPLKPKIEILEPKPAAVPLATSTTPSPQAMPSPQKTSQSEPAQPSAEVSNSSPAVVTQIVGDAAEPLKLKNEMDNRNKKIEELEGSLNQAREDLAKMQDTSKNAEVLDDLRKKISKLEARLKEYAIIEDDIASLIAIKNDNEKLKTEIALLRKKAVPEAAELQGPKVSSPDSAVDLPNDSPGASWPLSSEIPKKTSKKADEEFDKLMNTQIKTAVDETVDQTNANEGEKLISEFQDFMKGLH